MGQFSRYGRRSNPKIKFNSIDYGERVDSVWWMMIPVIASEIVPSPPAIKMESGSDSKSSMYLRAWPSESVLITSIAIPAKCKIGAQYFSN